MDKFYSVDELAKAGNATPRAIRLYVDKGLLEPMRIGFISPLSTYRRMALGVAFPAFANSSTE